MKLVAYHSSLRDRGGAELLMIERMQDLRGRGHDVRLMLLDLDPAVWADPLAGLPYEVVRPSWRERVPLTRGWRQLQLRAIEVAAALGQSDVLVGFNYPCSLLPAFADVANMVWHCCEPSRQIHLATANPALSKYAEEDRSERDEARCLNWFRSESDYRRRKPRVFAPEAEFDRIGISRMRSVVAISEYSSQLVQRTYGRKADAVVSPVVRPPPHVTRSGGLAGKGLRCLLHTRLHAHKNADTVVRGFALYRRGDGAATLDIVGEGPERPHLEALVGELEISEAVRFHGYLAQSELEDVYGRCDVMAFLPMDEPFGMVFPEAALRGLLLIGPDHGGPMEILDGGRLGQTVDALSPEALAEAMSEIGHWSAAEVDRRREATAAACRDRYARDAVGRQFEAVLARV